MTSPEEIAAQTVLDVQPSPSLQSKWGRIVSLDLAITNNVVTGAERVAVAMGDATIDCTWLASFDRTVAAGKVAVGSPVVIHEVDGQAIISDLIVGAKSIG